jgi:hypothetical protein
MILLSALSFHEAFFYEGGLVSEFASAHKSKANVVGGN